MNRFALVLFLPLAMACEMERLEPVPPGASETASSTVPNRPPDAPAVTPSSGEGSAVVLTLRFSDPDGASDLNWGQALIHDQLDAPSSCYIHWEHAAGTLHIRNDSGDALIGPARPARRGALENTQCSIDTAAARAVVDETGVTLTVPIQFRSFTGPKKIFLRSADHAGHTLEWAEFGSWTVP